MVGLDISVGQDVVRALDDARLKVNVALWTHLPEYADWRLVLAGRQFDAAGLANYYPMLHDSLDPAGFTPYNTPLIQIMPMKDPFIRSLRKIFGKTQSVEGMRIGGQMIGDRFIEDGYVYRIS